MTLLHVKPFHCMLNEPRAGRWKQLQSETTSQGRITAEGHIEGSVSAGRGSIEAAHEVLLSMSSQHRTPTDYIDTM